MADKNKTKKVASYNDDDIQVIMDDVLRLRERFEMYIGYNGTLAFLHLIKEVLQNSIDEAVAKGSSCDEILIDYNVKKKSVKIIDNGRGIPIKKIVAVCTYLQSSGKFKKGEDNAYKFSAGLNGVGLTAANALSKMCIVTVQRDGIKYRAEFKEGRLVKEGKIGTSNKTGTEVEFIPDESVLGPVDLDYNVLLELAETMSHLSKIKIKVHVTAPGKDGDINKTYKSNGIVDALIDLAGKKNMLIDPIYFKQETKDKTIEVAMTYVSDCPTEQVLSYCNYCTTVDHGTPLAGVKAGLTQVMSKFIRENCMNKNEQKSLQITGDDCRTGWTCVINVNHIKPSFVGQVKEKVNNEDFVPFARKTTMDALKSWMETDEKEAKKIGNIIKKMAKVRAEGQKIRQSTIAKQANIFTINEKKYAKATGKDDLELLIIEGDSAAGTTKQARDRTFQEVYAMKGVPMNTYGMKYFDILKNAELRGLATAAGCDMGPKHDVSKCRHKRYIIMTDADIDGNKITSLLAVFFLCHMRGIVENGMLYKMAPPLYKTTGAGSRYIDNMKELNQLIQKEISKNLDIKSLSTKKMLKEKDIRTILENNKNYLRELTKLSNKYAIDPIVIEFVLSHHDKSYPAIAKLLNKQFKFITATAKKDKLMIEGVFNKEFQYAVIDSKLAKKAKEVEKFIDINKKLYGMEFEVNKTKMSLYQMLNKFKNYTPKMTRFKGLGEMNSKDLWETSLNPENRHLIRLTVEDLEKDVERFALLHSTKKKDVEARAKLFESFKIGIEDIDN